MTIQLLSWEQTTSLSPEQIKAVRSIVINILTKNEKIGKVYLTPLATKDSFIVILDDDTETTDFSLELADIYWQAVDRLESENVWYHFDFDYMNASEFALSITSNEVYVKQGHIEFM